MPLSWNEIRVRAAAFSASWKDRALNAREKADAQTFLTDFFNVFGVKRSEVAIFEKKVSIGGELDFTGEQSGGRHGYIDLFWKKHIVIEMKSPGKDLEKAYLQAKEYVENLPSKDFPLGILISDFNIFVYYNLEKGGEKTAFSIGSFADYVELFGYLAGYRDVIFEAASPVDIEAAERMAGLHEALKETGYEGHDLEVYLVRILFCLSPMTPGFLKRKKPFTAIFWNAPAKTEAI
jgi:hypothetical protein